MKLKNATVLFGIFALACDPAPIEVTPNENTSLLSLSEVAKIMSELPLQNENLMEVYSAVESSSGNGYDEEYMMSDLFASPGKGVGESYNATKASAYSRPLKDLLTDYFQNEFSTKAGTSQRVEVEKYLNSLQKSDIQIYWPYSEEWDGETFPIITFDPGYGVEENYGYEIAYNEQGYKVVDSVLVNEDLAKKRPVWVINTNDDSAYTPLIIEDQEGYLSENSVDYSPRISATNSSVERDPKLERNSELGPSSISTKAKDADDRSLYIEAFKMLRSYDSWFGGASEFLIKCGAVNGFKATTDEELKLYTPSVTDMMIVIKRSQIGLRVPIRSLLLSEYTPQMEKIAFLVIEDDGGKTTSWKCSAVVKVKSKSTGFELDIPYKDNDDIVWRGQLTRSFFGDKREFAERFGDVELTFGLR